MELYDETDAVANDDDDDDDDDDTNNNGIVVYLKEITKFPVFCFDKSLL